MDSKKFTVWPWIEVNLTQQDIDDIMCTALEGGICYWCGRVDVMWGQAGKSTHEQLTRGGILILHDAESAQTWELTLGKFLNGVKLYLEQGCHVQIEDNAIDAGDIDANDADCIVQFAIFEEVVFG